MMQIQNNSCWVHTLSLLLIQPFDTMAKRHAGQLSSLLRRSSGGGEGAEQSKLSSTTGHEPAEDPYLVWFILLISFLQSYKVVSSIEADFEVMKLGSVWAQQGRL